jgi:hypothetical protein
MSTVMQSQQVATMTKRQVIQPDEIEEPPTKKVRFSGVTDLCDSAQQQQCTAETSSKSSRSSSASSPKEIAKLMQRVRRRAEKRKHGISRSPPPPPPPEETDEVGFDLHTMQRRLQQMERDIKESARLELQLLNQSKKMRDERSSLTRKYESMAEQLREMQSSQQPEGDLFQLGSLPPLMVKSRRVSHTKADPTRIVNLAS